MNWKCFFVLIMIATMGLWLGSNRSTPSASQSSSGMEDILCQFGVPCTDWCEADLSGLDPFYRQMALRLLSASPEERPPLAFCVAPGTPIEVVQRLEELVFGGHLDYQLGTRWSSTAHGGTGGQGDPITLAYSYVPDGVWVPGGAGEPGSANSLFATLNYQFGSTALWQSKFAQVFARWSELTGITYEQSSDDGASLFNSPGVIGVRGDVRISCHNIDGGSGILAYCYYPNGGDMVLDASENWGSSWADYRFFRNTVMHEHGHGIGLGHVCPANGTKLMEPYLNTNFDGPRHDDERGGQRHYGDTYENNETYTVATNLGSIEGTYNLTEVCMDDNSESDYYKFTVTSNRMVSITLTPTGWTYQSGPETGNCDTGTEINSLTINNLDLYLYSTDGTTLLTSSTSHPAGQAETITNYIFPSSGTFYVRVASGSTNDVQTYTLTIKVEKYVALYAPNGGETWYVGESKGITWNCGVSGMLTISLNRNYPTGGWEILYGGTANDGIESWAVAGTTTSNARIRIISDSQPTQGDTSDANFTIANPYLTVTSPNGGESWYASESHWLYWTSGGLTGNVDITINRNYPAGAWEPLFTNIPNDGSEQWTVTEPTASNARIRIVSVSSPSVRDSSNADFTILARYVHLTAPNGGETWYVNDTENTTWESLNVPGTVSISINYSYPGGPWQNIATSTQNDGIHPWQVVLPTTSTARIRIISDSYPTIGDTSNSNFTISDQVVITVSSPNGDEVWVVDDIENITWVAEGIPGNVKIELNRDYPLGSWETLFASTTNDESEPWPVSGPITNAARVRVSSVAQPAVSDISDADFAISQDNPPVIWHDPKDDGAPGYVLFVAGVSDEIAVDVVRLFWRISGGGAFDSTDMDATGNPDEYAATLSLADAGSYDYYIKARDVSLQVSTTDIYDFQLYPFCGTTISYDDGSAERYNWGGAEEFRWAVRFTPASTPFILCGARFSVSRISPDSAHSRIFVEVYSESAGLPGTLLFRDTTGSIGNVVGGLPPGQTHWADAVIRNGSGEPLVFYGDFFIAVGNPDTLLYEAFSRDTTSPNSGRSFLYDGCTLQWFNENDACGNCKPGERMVRAVGYYQAPPQIVVYRAGDDVELYWTSTGAPYYRIYSDATPFGSYATSEGSTSDTVFVDVGAVTDATLKFYRVLSATQP
jgi:hypothetical protein